jgi:hypothetical protein
MPLLTTQSAKGFGFGKYELLSSNSFESIQTITVGSTSQASISFTSIPSTYTHLQVRGILRSTTATGTAFMNFNGDTANNYTTHYIFGDGTIGVGAINPHSGMYAALANNAASTFAVCVINILDYKNTNKNKVMLSLSGGESNTNTGATYDEILSGVWESTSAINRIDLIPAAGNFAQYSSLALYGING